MSVMAASCTRPRKSYQKIKPSIDHPYLIEVQKKSYGQFLQRDVDVDKREDVGLQAVFSSIFPIKDFAGTASLEFVSYSFDQPKYAEDECRQRGMSYAAPLKVVVRLVLWDTEKEAEGEEKTIKDVKEQEVYFGEMPLMTESGTFVINGTERVVVSQLHRSSGVFFDHDKGKTVGGGKVLFTARVIPYRGSWLDFEFDSKDILHVRIDRRRKMHVSILLRALGYSTEELLKYYYKIEKVRLDGEKAILTLDYSRIRGQRSEFDIVDPKSGDMVVKKGRRISMGVIKKLKTLGLEEHTVAFDYILGKVTASDIYCDDEILIPSNTLLEDAHLEQIKSNDIKEIDLLCIDGVDADFSFRNTILGDKVETSEEALVEVYKRLRPGDPPSIEQAKLLFDSLFFNPERYDLSVVGRHKLNLRTGSKEPLESRVLSKDDIMLVVRYLLKLKVGQGFVDDIDHLGNRRVRAVGELLENQYRIGLLRIERVVKERLQLQDIETLLPHDFINNKPAAAVVKEFFGSSQLSQFMDQTNPLSEITHKRRLSALGPGGLSRERAGFEVRDVHPTHYGRICPVETPEGPNIGLISSLASYATINQYGFIETPYKRLVAGEEKDETVGSVRYYTASEEDQDHVVAQASDSNSKLDPSSYISVRRKGDTETVRAEEADLSDVASTQLVSVAANLIPFLQNDDANRALMGSNMMRQAVPLIKTRAPLVGTGMEKIVARDSGACVVARRPGSVVSVDASRIVVKVEEKESQDHVTEVGADVDIYTLKKYSRSNLDTCINQKPIVRVGDKVKPGDVIGDGFATEVGELALGQNVRVAFMPWNGYNFEDSILISERVVKEDLYTSVHIQEFECVSRDTKLGQEEITADIPNVSDEALVSLDDAGIIRVGAEVGPDDILVGKITPKGETQLSPEEKLLRAIFGEKAGDVRDTSLRVPPGVNGVVIACKVFSRAGADVDSRSQQIAERDTRKLRKDEKDKIDIIKESAKRRILQLTEGHKLAKTIQSKDGQVIVEKGTVITEDLLTKEIPYTAWYDLTVDDFEKATLLAKVLVNLQEKINQIKLITTEMIAKITKGDELPPGVIKMVKVFVAIKRKLRVGDKMAGRHGNKGVISRILPEQDMPFTEDGVPVDVVLNPLGVPSRMNVGQILETHLGWSSYKLGEKLNNMIEQSFDRPAVENMCLKIWEDGGHDHDVAQFIKSATDDELKEFVKKYKEGVHFANPVFDGANEEEIFNAHKDADVSTDFQSQLYDGLTGEKFHNRVTVGIMYVLKLHHLVDEKIHARSIGPYSLVTQQPLGGKAQFGGQRLGEMEVWAMEAYGAAYTLQEMLTVKSDDVQGRTRMYESIVKGNQIATPGIPESFNVLVKELQSLSMDITLVQKKLDEKNFDFL